jgi:hypothetical protein
MPPTIEDLRSLDLDSFLSSVIPTCSNFAAIFWLLYSERKAAGDPSGSEAALLLGKVCHFYFRPDWPGNPWGPMEYGGRTRSVAAEDLSDEELDVLAAFAAEIKQPELRARVADVLWECKRGHIFARMAIEAYRALAIEKEDLVSWVDFLGDLERAVDLAARIGCRKELHTEILDEIQKLAEKCRSSRESGLLSGRLMQILLRHRYGDNVLNAAMCEELGAVFTSLKKWNFADAYWEWASSWHRMNKADGEAERCQRALGESMISRGQDEAARVRLGCSYSAGWLARGIEILRRSSADRKRIEDLHKELLEKQAQAMSEFHTFERPGMELYEKAHKESRDWIRAHLTGLSLEEAISRFVAAMRPTDTATLRSSLVSGSGGSFRFAVDVATVDAEGKTAGSVEGRSLVEGPTEEQIRAAMFEQARTSDWPLACEFVIEPGRSLICEEHRLRLCDLAFLVHANAFVPPGHEYIYLRGIHAGFCGDFLAASHLLIPQLEQSIRLMLRSRGVITSTLEGNVQMERDLGWLLTHETAVEAFGDDLLFDLRGILIEKFGENLRNNMCHGLMSAEAFDANSGSWYCWWLTLRLLWLGVEYTRHQVA